jgi:cell division transport system ATP-binding protein
MQELSPDAGGTSRFPQTPSTGPLRGQGASAPSARISAFHEPEQPVEAASAPRSVHQNRVLDDSSTDATVTALAEPERTEPGRIETEEFLAPIPVERDSNASAMIVFEDVQKIYEPGVTALDGVSFTIEKGEFVFVVGASGSGKSTVIRLILKELEPTQGRIVVGGRDLGRLKRSKVPLLRRNVGCVFQDFKLLPNRTAAENIGYALRVQGQSSAQIRKKVPEVLNLVGLPHKMNSRPEELSGGEQQRVSIARAFVNHPPLLVCDEPTGNLDPDTSVGIMQLLYRISRTGTTILMVTHDREMVDKMRRRVIALEGGKLVRDERRGGYAEE